MAVRYILTVGEETPLDVLIAKRGSVSWREETVVKMSSVVEYCYNNESQDYERPGAAELPVAGSRAIPWMEELGFWRAWMQSIVRVVEVVDHGHVL